MQINLFVASSHCIVIDHKLQFATHLYGCMAISLGSWNHISREKKTFSKKSGVCLYQATPNTVRYIHTKQYTQTHTYVLSALYRQFNGLWMRWKTHTFINAWYAHTHTHNSHWHCRFAYSGFLPLFLSLSLSFSLLWAP